MNQGGVTNALMDEWRGKKEGGCLESTHDQEAAT